MDTLPDIGQNPDYGMGNTPKFTMDATNFNDGYVQRRLRGLNPRKEIHNLSWTALTTAQADTLFNFLVQKAGVEAFIWNQPHNRGPLVVRCGNPKRVETNYEGFKVTGTFEQEFGL